MLEQIDTPYEQENPQEEAYRTRDSEYDYSYSWNRELSWLNFNKRVLAEAMDDGVPLLEKLNFLKIFSSNLDEFFMVRVGKLSDLALLRQTAPDNKSGMTPQEQLEAVFRQCAKLYDLRDKVFRNVEKRFRDLGVYNLAMSELSKAQKKAVYKYFKIAILPVLSPFVIGLHSPNPFLENKSEYVILKLDGKDGIRYGITQIPAILPKITKLPTYTGYPFIRTSKVIYTFIDECYPKSKILGKTIIRVTRNADLSADDEISYEESDYRDLMKKILKKRKRLQAVRVELNEKDKDAFVDYLCESLGIQPAQIFESEAPLSMDYVSEVKEYLNKEFISAHSYSKWLPRLGPKTGSAGDMLGWVKARDRLLSYPYDSMDPFLKLMEQAASDDRVVSIKITIYRLARHSRLVESLCRAAERGKDVMVLMELRARFDEQQNLDYSKQLFDSGCKIIYGMGGYKVHSKICLITMRDKQGWSYITQIGTGNYNEETAGAYADLCLMTADRKLGEDAILFFRNLQIGNLNGRYEKLLQSPSSLKTGLLARMDTEIAKGRNGALFFKMNSLTDRDFIDKLREASEAGVSVRLIVRGICCLLPGVGGKTDHIEAHSIVGRFLEHARIYMFGKEDPTIYIGSADLMTRNTEHRVELLAPVEDRMIKKQLEDYMETQFADTIKGRRFTTSGDLQKIKGDAEQTLSSQEIFMQKACHQEETEPRGWFARLFFRRK